MTLQLHRPDGKGGLEVRTTRDRNWRTRLLDQLKTVPASAFEAVDVSACMVRPDSGKADCA